MRYLALFFFKTNLSISAPILLQNCVFKKMFCEPFVADHCFAPWCTSSWYRFSMGADGTPQSVWTFLLRHGRDQFTEL